MRKTLAEEQGVGRIVVCDNCDRIHLVYGRITLDLNRGEFSDLARMIRSALRGLSPGKEGVFGSELTEDTAAAELQVVH